MPGKDFFGCGGGSSVGGFALVISLGFGLGQIDDVAVSSFPEQHVVGSTSEPSFIGTSFEETDIGQAVCTPL